MRASSPRLPRQALLPSVLVALAVSALPSPIEARQVELLDRFAIRLGASFIEADTSVRLDSEAFGIGTEIDFEGDLGFESSEVVPTLSLELLLARRHRLSASWQDLDRESAAVLARDIRFGDVVFPIRVEVEAELDLTDYRLGYTYWPMRGDRAAFGLTLGVRVLELRAALAIDSLDRFDEGDVTGPLPFVGLEYRQGLGARTRLQAQVGLLEIEIDDVSGDQYHALLGVEHLTLRNIGFGADVSLSRIEVDTEDSGFRGAVELDFLALTVFSKLRW